MPDDLILLSALSIVLLMLTGTLYGMRIKQYTNEYGKDGLLKLNQFLQALPDDTSTYTFYTDGHPYVWVETSLESIQDQIKQSHQHHQPYGLTYEVQANEQRKAIYFVSIYRGKVAWPSLMHDDEWAESNKKVAENIRRYKAAQAKPKIPGIESL